MSCSFLEAERGGELLVGKDDVIGLWGGKTFNRRNFFVLGRVSVAGSGSPAHLIKVTMRLMFGGGVLALGKLVDRECGKRLRFHEERPALCRRYLEIHAHFAPTVEWFA